MRGEILTTLYGRGIRAKSLLHLQGQFAECYAPTRPIHISRNSSLHPFLSLPTPSLTLHNIQVILVPQGAEHQAVCRGLRGILRVTLVVLPIPVGSLSVTTHLEHLHQEGWLTAGQNILVMGLCGGLVPDLCVGTPVLYEGCITTALEVDETFIECDRALTAEIHRSLSSVQTVKAVTSDRVISRAIAKQQLAQTSGAAVVDMEGFTTLQLLTTWGVSVATLRVTSDDCQHDIPDLSHAFDANGSLKPAALTAAFLKHPIAALYLIRGSLKSLKILQNLTSELFK